MKYFTEWKKINEKYGGNGCKIEYPHNYISEIINLLDDYTTLKGTIFNTLLYQKNNKKENILSYVLNMDDKHFICNSLLDNKISIINFNSTFIMGYLLKLNNLAFFNFIKQSFNIKFEGIHDFYKTGSDKEFTDKIIKFSKNDIIQLKYYKNININARNKFYAHCNEYGIFSSIRYLLHLVTVYEMMNIFFHLDVVNYDNLTKIAEDIDIDETLKEIFSNNIAKTDWTNDEIISVISNEVDLPKESSQIEEICDEYRKHDCRQRLNYQFLISHNIQKYFSTAIKEKDFFSIIFISLIWDYIYPENDILQQIFTDENLINQYSALLKIMTMQLTQNE